jgi:type IV pilus assembly protein PilY1
MGLSYGTPVIGKRPSDGKWVVWVTSGYNNIGPGGGGGYLYTLDLATGAILEKVGTTVSGVNVGTASTPSGFAKISGFVLNQTADNTVAMIYGGDLFGNVWRFDLSTAPATATRIGQAFDGSSPPRPQSVTTQPELTRFDAGFTVVYVGTGRFIGVSDLGDPSLLTPLQPLPSQPGAYQQSLYAFKDTGSDLGNLRSTGNLVQQSITVVDAATRSITNNAVNWGTNNGWYVDLNPHCATAGCNAAGESPGERVNIDIQLVRGTLAVIANEPNAEVCSAGGDSFLYQFDYKTGSYVPGTAGGIVGTKVGNTLSVGIVIFQTLTGQMKSVITTADGQLPQQSINTSGGTDAPRRAAWRELLDTRTSPSDVP